MLQNAQTNNIDSCQYFPFKATSRIQKKKKKEEDRLAVTHLWKKKKIYDDALFTDIGFFKTTALSLQWYQEPDLQSLTYQHNKNCKHKIPWPIPLLSNSAGNTFAEIKSFNVDQSEILHLLPYHF